MPSIEQIEQIKREGTALNLPQMAWQGYRAVSPDDHYRLKFQGVCTQRNPQASPDGFFFLRIKIPFGQVKASQLTLLAELAEQHGRGWGHLTTRQGMELHSVRLEDVPQIFERLEEAGLTTKAACGDTIRNVVTCQHVGETPVANRHETGPLFDVRPWALLVQNHFLEIGPENLNLPRKMNVYVTSCPQCVGHARINDLGLVATTRRGPNGLLEPGFALWVGGGLGANPVLAQPLESFLSFDQVLPALEAVVRLYMDHGSRKSRASAKLKFLIEEWGMGRFCQEYRRYYEQVQPRFASMRLPSRPRLLMVQKLAKFHKNIPDGLQSDCGQEVNVLVPSGEIRAEDLRQMASLVELFGEGHVYFTREQNIRFKNLNAKEAADLRAALQAAGLRTEGAGRIDDVLACPGTAFCPVACTPSLSTGEKLSQHLEALIRAGNMPAEIQKLRIHISGCPNSCAQHQMADIGLSGTRVHTRSKTYSGLGYQLFLGGNLEGVGKLALLVHYGIPEELIDEVILAVLAFYQQEKQHEEEFSAYVHRLGQEYWEVRLGELLNTVITTSLTRTQNF